MKKLVVILFTILSTVSFAQQNWCATDMVTKNYFDQHPEEKAAFLNQQVDLINAAPVKGGENNKVPTIIVPVVVHVIHHNGTGNITKQQIDDGIRILNEDFNKLNPDTSTVRTVFKPYISDAQIEFRLATIDPNGNCTEGVNRINSFDETFDADNSVKSISYWNANNYLNVWVVNTIRSFGSGGGTILGYAQFPGGGSLNTYGLVVRADEWGSIGVAAGKDGRTVTHEVGHCLGLFHTFQSACGFNCHNSGDFVCDTPPQFDDNNNSCNFSLNTCSNDATGGTTANSNPYNSNVPDQLENYMGYGIACLGMFTEGQKDRMQAVFTSFSFLNNLRSQANLVATGTDNNAVTQTCAPKADIVDQIPILTCVGGQVSFDEQSYNGPVTTYDWEFPGATPTTSNSATPMVTYTTPGVHDVILRVSNASGADTLLIQDYVYVDDTATAFSGLTYREGFESPTVIGSDWIIQSPTGNTQWARSTNGAFKGSASVFLNNFSNNGSGESDFLISPSIDLTLVQNPTFQFDVAFKTNGTSSDNLRCAISIDCGQSWITRAVIPASSLSTGARSNAFIPNSTTDWKPFTITTTSAIRNSDNAIFRFQFINGGGNNIYIDNFRVAGDNIVGIENIADTKNQLKIYPNPVSDGNSTLEFQLNEGADNAEIFLTDLLGKRVANLYSGSLNNEPYRFEVDTDGLEAGIYFLSLTTENNQITKKLVVR